MSFPIDTDICSAYLRRPSKLASRIQQYYGRLHLSAITVGELRAWALRKSAPPTRIKDLDALLRVVVVLGVTLPVADRFGALRAAQLDSGLPMPQLDLLIAATALEHQLIVVTHNTRHFAAIPGLQLVDWLAP